jgi:hypothetical protein
LGIILEEVNEALQGSPHPGNSGDMVDGKPLLDIIRTLNLQVEVIQSRMQSQVVRMGGILFESYEDTYWWVYTSLNENYWTYVLDIPGVYTLVQRDGKGFTAMLDEEVDVCKVGYYNANNPHITLSYTSMFPDIFKPDKTPKVEGRLFPAIDAVLKWESSGVQKGFSDEVGDTITALEKAHCHRIETQMMHQPEHCRLFSAMLMKLVDHMNALRHMVDKNNTRYQEICGAQQAVGNWTLICLFTEAAFSGAWKARLVGADAFSDKTDPYIRGALCLWAVL